MKLPKTVMNGIISWDICLTFVKLGAFPFSSWWFFILLIPISHYICGPILDAIEESLNVGENETDSEGTNE